MDYEANRKMRLEQCEQLLASGMTVAEWSRLNRVSESTMYDWLRRFRELGLIGAGKANGWIEIDRKAERAEVALAVAPGNPEIAASTAQPGPAAVAGPHAGEALPPIRLHANGIGVEFPHGACESDLAAVLRAAMSL